MLRGCWFCSEKLRFRKNFDENFNTVERVQCANIKRKRKNIHVLTSENVNIHECQVLTFQNVHILKCQNIRSKNSQVCAFENVYIRRKMQDAKTKTSDAKTFMFFASHLRMFNCCPTADCESTRLR